MSVVLSAMDLKRGAKVPTRGTRTGMMTRPLQFLSREEKDEDWAADNMDWLEMIGLQQVARKSKRILKNYKLAAGIIDKGDYICEDNPEMADLLDVLTREEQSAMQLQDFPIIATIMDLFTGEFAERSDKIMYRAIDNRSYNEMLAEKSNEVGQRLLFDAEQEMLETMRSMGIAPESEQGQQMLSEDNLKSLPQIEEFYNKDYRSSVEEWAQHQHAHDMERFKIPELEMTAFRDLLSNETEVWHFDMREDDYEVGLWNPAVSFQDVSPGIKYISQGNHAGTFDLFTAADVIDRYGYKMTADQMESLQMYYPVRVAGYLQNGKQNDGSFYDATKSYEWNTNMPSLAMRQYTSRMDFLHSGDDIVSQILSEGDEPTEFGNTNLLRVMTGYWKSQRMLYYLTEMEPQTGMPVKTIVDETFKVTTKPVYNTTIKSKKSADTLIYGQHLEPLWINEVWGGVKIGPNRPAWSGSSTAQTDGFQPIYLDVKPLKFQFKGDFSLWGCKLPVEGVVNTARNTKPHGLVDRLKPFQIGYNLQMNQIQDISIDELGTVILLDQNILPQHSLGEDWGRGNYAKAYTVMKNFGVMPVDTGIANTETPLNMQHAQVMDLSQTQRLLGKVNLANFFKEGAFEVIGITPQRRGDIGGQETAEGVRQSTSRSYAMTEKYFIQHSEHIMPRVHGMRTDLAQYYHSTNPSVRLSYMTSEDEKVNFLINGTTLLCRDINVYVTTRTNQRRMMEQIRQLAIQNNTAGASIFDLGNLIKAESLAEVQTVLKSIETKIEQQRSQDQQHEQELQGQSDQAAYQRQLAQQQFEAEQKMLDRSNEVTVAEIRSAGYQVGDLNGNNESDYQDILAGIEQRRLQGETLQLKREQMVAQNGMKERELSLKQQELQTRKDVAAKQLEVARANKNRFDVKKPPTKK